MILLVGLAVGVDYSLFYIRREREERAKGHDKLDALDIAAATSGRAVLISGLTVIIAMAGMFVTGNTTFMGMGLGTILVVAVAVLGSLTVLPAMLAALGDQINKGRIPFLAPPQRGDASRASGAGLIDRVMRRPVVAVVLAGGLLVALSIPALGMQTKLSGIEELPKDLAVIQTYQKVQDRVPVRGRSRDRRGQGRGRHVTGRAGGRSRTCRRSAKGDPQVAGPIGVEVNPSHTVARLNVGLPGTGSDAASKQALKHLREDLLPATIGSVHGVDDRGLRHRRRERRLQHPDEGRRRRSCSPSSSASRSCCCW